MENLLENSSPDLAPIEKSLTALPLTRGNIHRNALWGISEGIRACAEVVGATMGAGGRNVILEEERYPGHSITNDGATIIEKMVFNSPLERIGHSLVKEATDRSNRNSGDGSSTTVVLLDAILQEAKKYKGSPLALKRELDECLAKIEAEIDARKRTITEDDVDKVALIAGESEALASILKEIYKEIGKEGIITLEGSGTEQTNYTLIKGIRFTDTGYLSPYMVHDEIAKKAGARETKAVYENPTILVTKRKIEHLNDVNPLLQEMTKRGQKDLIIFTNDMDSGVASVLIKAHKEGIINCLVIKAPTLWSNYVFEDFARVTGSTIVEDSAGINFKNLNLGHLGTCDKIIVDKEETIIIGGKDISDHLADLKQKGDTDSMLRLSWLTTKTAILRLGSKSEAELSYLRLKAEDAIHSCRLALQDGVVEGGGLCLAKISAEVPENTAGLILARALQAPTRQICQNAGIEINPTIMGGYDAKTGQPCDMYEAGIIDAARIVKMAVRNAIGVASIALTSETLITLPEKTPEQIAAEVLQKKGLRM